MLAPLDGRRCKSLNIQSQSRSEYSAQKVDYLFRCINRVIPPAVTAKVTCRSFLVQPWRVTKMHEFPRKGELISRQVCQRALTFLESELFWRIWRQNCTSFLKYLYLDDRVIGGTRVDPFGVVIIKIAENYDHNDGNLLQHGVCSQLDVVEELVRFGITAMEPVKAKTNWFERGLPCQPYDRQATTFKIAEATKKDILSDIHAHPSP